MHRVETCLSMPTTITSSESASKKLNPLKGKQPAGKVAVKSSSSSFAHKSKSSSARVAKITQTTVLHGMQGTIN